jgi:hypothetical protein
MTYTIPSYKVRPGAAYQPGVDLVPLNVKSDARFIGAAYPNLYPFDSTKLLDQSPLHLGTRRAGQQGRSIDLNGTNQAVRVADNTALDITDNLTVCVWGKNNESNIVDNQYIFAKYDTTGNNREWGILFESASDNFNVNFGNQLAGTFSGRVSSDVIPALNIWNHYVFSFSSGTVKMYINGVSTVVSLSSGVMPTSLFNGSSDLVIGAILSSPSLSSLWDGQIFDARIYAGDSTVLTDAQILSIYEDGPNNTQFAGQDLRAHYKLDEGSGITNYDSSGNENHGTIENAVSNWGVTQDVMSFQNQVGYNLSGAVFTPRDESDPTNDVLGNPLTYTGIRPNDAALINSSCVDLNGTNQAVRVADNTELDITNNLTVCVWAKNDASSLSTPEILFSRYEFGTANREWRILVSSDEKLQLSLGAPSTGGLQLDYVSDDAISINNINHYAFTFNSGSVQLYFNGLPISGSIISGSVPATLFNGSADLMVGANLQSGNIDKPWDGQIFDARIYAGDSTVLTDAQILSIYEDGVNNVEFEGQSLRARYACSEGAGTGALDYSGNGNDGTIENAVSNWGVTQNVFHANLLEGFSLYEHASSDPIRVKFVNGSPRSFTPPTGYTLTAHYPIGNFRTPAETEINFNPDSTPEMGGQLGSYTALAAHAFGEDIDPGATDQGFARQTASKEDRFAIFAEPQTGGNLTTIERWTT